MALLEKISDEKAEDGLVKEVFDMMNLSVGSVPEPMRMLAVSPGLFEVQTRMIGYYRNHPRLSGELLTFIRYLAARFSGNRACEDFNKDMLKRQGIREEELETIIEDPLAAPLEKRECALLAFVVSGVKDVTSATHEAVSQLREMGWLDSDIVDCVNHGFSIAGSGRMLRFFKIM